MYYGWADPALNPMMGVEYYERVMQTMGAQTPEFFRLFMMPGVFHCSGGVGPDRVDTITPLIAWVEKGAAPDRLVATQKVGDTIRRTRPLCVYPQVAKHRGQGSVDEAGASSVRRPECEARAARRRFPQPVDFGCKWQLLRARHVAEAAIIVDRIGPIRG